jgi:hypothetical protein
MPSLHVLLDQVDIAFDDERAVAWAGLLLPATLAERLGSSPRGRRGGCLVSPNLARQHAADLRRTRFAETASSWLSH